MLYELDIAIEASTECNAKCEFCSRKNLKENIVLDVDALIKFIKKYITWEPNNYDKTLTFTGLYGDVMQYKYIIPLLEFLGSLDIEIRIFTNGAYNPGLNKLIKENTIMIFSIDSTLKHDTYRQINNQLSISNLLSLDPKIQKIVKSLKFKYNEKEIFKLNETLNQHNIDHYVVKSRAYLAGDLIFSDYKLPQNVIAKDRFVNKICPLTYKLNMSVNHLGYIYPCCNIMGKNQNILHIKDIVSFEQVKDMFKLYKYFIGAGCYGCKFKPKKGIISKFI